MMVNSARRLHSSTEITRNSFVKSPPFYEMEDVNSYQLPDDKTLDSLLFLNKDLDLKKNIDILVKSSDVEAFDAFLHNQSFSMPDDTLNISDLEVDKNDFCGFEPSHNKKPTPLMQFDENQVTFVKTSSPEETDTLLQYILKTDGVQLVSLDSDSSRESFSSDLLSPNRASTPTLQKDLVSSEDLTISYQNYIMKSCEEKRNLQNEEGYKSATKNQNESNHQILEVSESQVFQETISAIGRALKSTMAKEGQKNINIEIVIEDKCEKEKKSKTKSKKRKRSDDISVELLLETLLSLQRKKPKKIFRHRRNKH